MSDNYKVIRRTRDEVRELKAQAWSQSKIAKHIGVSSAMIGDLLELDEVAQDLRKPTIDKFRKFLDTRAAAKQHLYEISDQPAAHNDPGGLGDVHFWPKKEDTSVGLLNELTVLSARFANCGYRLDASLTMIHYPNENEQKV